MINMKDIRSLTDFQRNTRVHLRRLNQTRRPEILTVNGKAALIIQDAEAFEEMLDSIRGIHRGLEELKAGQGQPARKVLERIRARHKIPRSPR
jgi:PHD/YefM family antitoxin component YafN of YafNO toxin-antitoxin module